MRCYTQTLDTRFLDGVNPPSFVKTASFVEGDATSKLPDGSFALVVLEKSAANRMMPIHDPAHVWVSAQYLAKTWPGMPKTAAAMAARNIRQAADFFEVEIPESLAKVASLSTAVGNLYQRREWDLPVGYAELQGPTKTAAYSMDGDVYPIGNLSELRAAQDWFDRNSEKLAYAHRYRMANFITSQRVNLIPPNEKTAAALPYTFPFSSKLAEIVDRTEINPQLDTELYKRASLCRHRQHAERYIGWALNKVALMLPGPAAAIDMVHAADVDSGLDKGYGSLVNDPIKTITSEPIESRIPDNTGDPMGGVDRPLRVDGVNGAPLTIREVCRSCDDGRVSKVMSQSFADTLKKNPEAILASLPTDVRSIVIHQIRHGAAQ